MKKSLLLKRQLICLFILLGSLSMYNDSQGQSVIHPYGTFCAGNLNAFAYTGPGSVTSWSVGGGGTIVSGGGTSSSISVQWNSPVSGVSVTANYNTGWSSGSTSFNNINISSSVTPSVTIGVSSNNICAGTSVTFTATPVNGGSTPTYNWAIDGSYVSSGSSNTFTTSSLTNGQQVTCLMYTSVTCYTTYTALSNAITMTVNTPQTMSLTISGTTSVCQGSQASFGASVSNGTGTLSYQWKKNGNNVSSEVSGPPPYVLVLNSVNNNDVISCVVSTTACANPATSNSLTISIVSPQTFSITPGVSQLTYCQGSSITFTANSSHPAYNYQWYLDGNAVSGASSSTFTTTASSVAQLQSISVSANTSATCVSNSSASGSAQNIPFTVNPLVTPKVSITYPIPVILGTATTFTANPVNGGSSPTYQWQLNGVNVSGATSNTYTPTINSGAQLQSITIIMSSSATCAINPALATNTVEIVSTQWENLNYIREHNLVIPNILNWVQVDQLGIGDKFQSTTYLDGSGRSIQSINKQTSQLESGAWADMVTHIEYDAAGRVEKSFIPYSSSLTIGKFKTNAKTEQENFIRSKYGEDVTAPTYSKTDFEKSPISRTQNVKAAGTSWGGNVNYNGISEQYEFNRAEEGIRIWNISFTTNSIPYSSATYPVGRLTKAISIDEKLKKVYTYYDFEGKLILKKVQDKESTPDLDENGHSGWLCTYYVYDDLGQLRSTITPKAVKYLEAQSWVFSNASVYEELCFYNEFDSKGRATIKHSPGAGQIQFVYDKKDRLILSQDENQRSRPSKQWSFFLYDELNRNVVSGLFDNATGRDAMADYVLSNLNNGNVPINIYTGASESIIVDNPIIGNSTYCNNCSNTIINVVQYFDNYGYSGVKSFNTNFSFATTTNQYVETSVKSDRTYGFVTGHKTRIIDQNYDDNNPNNDMFVVSTTYYNERGRSFQGLTTNIKTGTDYKTLQYDYTGKLLSVCDIHSMPGTSMTTFQAISKYEYNIIGQLTILSKKYGAQDYKKIAEYSYDEYGRIKNKKLSPDFNSGAGIENLKYDYNIQGLLIGINKDYALANTSLNQWDRFFGLYLGYDNRDNKFTAAQLNGNISGVIWKTQGDNMPRRYDYQYDNENRFKAALFVQKEKPTDANWSSAKIDFSVTDILYDENSNLMQMFQKGIMAGNNSPIFVDKLQYEYKSVAGGQWSNQLRKVFDQTTDLTSANNGLLGDFKDETYGINDDDYLFDGNGNMVKDNNKKIRIGSNAGVEYNFMDKPQKVTLENKSVVEFIYDATGDKLGKKITYTPTGQSKTTWYDDNYIYEESNSVVKLKMILHEEGRIRVFEPVSNPRINIGGNFDLPGTNTKGVFEYFIKDHLQNVRMVLTEETYSEYNNCTMETANEFYENRMFGQVDQNGNPVSSTNEVIISRKDKQDGASGWNSNSSVKVSKLQQNGVKIGPNMILKVMAGDQLTAQTSYFYSGTPNNGGAGSNFLSTVVQGLVGAISGSGQTGGVKNFSGNINTNYITNPGEFGSYLASQSQGDATPQAYLNILFFDENFNFVPYDNVTGLGSYGWRVGAGGDGQAPIVAPNVKAPKNGYAYVYLSNESQTAVFFDDFMVTHNRGRLIEESAYYPYGLKIKGISAKAFDKGENKYGYQGTFAEDEEETGWGEFELRIYDAQVGRWISTDPYDEFSSPYIGNGSDPVNNVDPTGGNLFELGNFFYHAAFTAGGAAVGGAIGFFKAEKGERLKGALVGAGIGAVAGFGISTVNWGEIGAFIGDRLPRYYWESGYQQIPFDVSRLSAAMLQQLTWELYNITGLNLRRSPGGLLEYEERKLFSITRRKIELNRRPTEIIQFAKPVVNKEGTSSIARRMLTSTVPNAGNRPVNVHPDTNPANPNIRSGAMPFWIQLDPLDWINTRRINLARMTWGIGMVFLHEVGHTFYGGLKSDPGNPLNGQFYTPGEKIKIGENETVMNRIRRQLGPSWGRRLSYHDISFDGGRTLYMPFNKGALKNLKLGLTPVGQYIQ